MQSSLRVATALADEPPLTLRDYAFAGLALFACPADSAPSEPAELLYLRQHALAVGLRSDEWCAGMMAALASPASVDEPLRRVSDAFRLSPIELLAVVLAVAVEEDLMCGRALALLQAPLGGSRPTVGLLVSTFAAAFGMTERAVDALVAGPAARCGLLNVATEGGPLPERAVSVPLHLCLALHAQDGMVPGVTIDAAGDAVPLPASIVSDAARHGSALDVDERRVLVLRTGSAIEGRAVANAVARACRRRAVFIDSDKANALAPWLLLRDLLPVFCFELAPGERKTLPNIPLYDGPRIVLCGPDGMVDAGDALAAQWALVPPTVDERRELWSAALDDSDLAAELSEHHRHGSGRIAQLGRLVRHRAALQGRVTPTMEDVAAAAWSLEGGGLDALAQAIPDRISGDAFVMTPALREDLQTLLLRCHCRDGLVEHLGASAIARYRPGVRALFVGPSGTGKTLAAAWLATQLSLPLYRVDLASVTSKYIGETEKNLAQLLARAEQAEVVLLFDEADSLFGKRTDVRDANDRFANAQTNYLLQRIETFEGIALLTSNSRARFDSAFARRLDAIVDFQLPGPNERRELWQSHLGSKHALSQRQLNQLAAEADIPGGHIRNAVLTAAVLAHETGRVVEFGDVVAGLHCEYRKLGRQLPVTLRVESNDA